MGYLMGYLKMVELGVLQNIPEDLVNKIEKNQPISGKKAVSAFYTRTDHCANCGYFEVLDWHHVIARNYDIPPMVDGKPYEHCLGRIRLCPNCHSVIHRESKGVIDKP